MKKLPIFEDFIPMGFGVPSNAAFSISGSPRISTGYNMNAIVGPVMEIGSCVAKEAYSYEANDNPEHKAEAYIKEAKHHINQKIDEAYENYTATNESRDPASIRKEYVNLKKMSIQGLRDIWSRAHRIGNPKELYKEDLIIDILVAKHGAKYINAAFESYDAIDEATDYEYDPAAHAERIKRREQQNLERFRAAQDRQDNYAIALYELKIKMDKIDLERLKVLTAIHDLKKKFDKL